MKRLLQNHLRLRYSSSSACHQDRISVWDILVNKYVLPLAKASVSNGADMLVNDSTTLASSITCLSHLVVP